MIFLADLPSTLLTISSLLTQAYTPVTYFLYQWRSHPHWMQLYYLSPINQ